jgi:hypothetical protein
MNPPESIKHSQGSKHKILETDDQLLKLNQDHLRHCDFSQPDFWFVSRDQLTLPVNRPLGTYVDWVRLNVSLLIGRDGPTGCFVSVFLEAGVGGFRLPP